MPGYALPPSPWYAWTESLLTQVGAPVTPTNINTIWHWTQKEATSAQWNYLATSQAAPGASAFNSSGVKNYPSSDVGAQATAQTLQNGLYPDIINMLRQSVPGPQWSQAARYQLDTWAHGPNGAHGTTYPNFLNSSSQATAQSNPNTGNTATGSAPLGINIPNPLDAIGSAIGSGVSGIISAGEVVLGAVILLTGVALLALAVVKGTSAGQAALGTAAKVIPAGRVARVAGGGGKAAKPARAVTVSPPAQAGEITSTGPRSQREADIVNRMARRSEARRMAEARSA